MFPQFELTQWLPLEQSESELQTQRCVQPDPPPHEPLAQSEFTMHASPTCLPEEPHATTATANDTKSRAKARFMG